MSKRKEDALRLKAVYEGAMLHEQLEQMRAQQRALERAGLDREASVIGHKITEKNLQIKAKIHEARQQRLALIREMLLCFAAGDIATTCADKMDDAFTNLAFGRDGEGGKAMAKLFRMQADDWNKCVQMVDGMGATEKVSELYADMAEDIVNAVVPVMYQVIDKYMKSDKGKILL